MKFIKSNFTKILIVILVTILVFNFSMPKIVNASVFNELSSTLGVNVEEFILYTLSGRAVAGRILLNSMDYNSICKYDNGMYYMWRSDFNGFYEIYV